MKNIVNAQWLSAHINNEDVIIVDCRSSLVDKEEGEKSYMQGHIPGAYFLNIHTQLTGEESEHGGRNPLPHIDHFLEAMEMMGVTNEKTIVAYDDNKLYNAARLWWQLKYIGFKNIYVLEGGIDHWKDAGYPLSQEVPEKKKGSLTPRIQEELLIDVHGVKKGLKRENFIILDARTKERYTGEFEPIDKIGGHIPGARLFPAHENLKGNGKWKELEQQKERYASVLDKGEVVVYCGSGINACMNFIALDELGQKPKLYVGSWSDWISYEDNPIAKGDKMV